MQNNKRILSSYSKEKLIDMVLIRHIKNLILTVTINRISHNCYGNMMYLQLMGYRLVSLGTYSSLKNGC